MNVTAQLTLNDANPPPPLYSSRLYLHQEGIMPLHSVIACAVDHGFAHQCMAVASYHWPRLN